jgi:hypothetical protein
MKRIHKIVIVGVVVLSIGFAVVGYLALWPRGPIPKEIMQQIDYGVYFPDLGKYKIDESSIKYDSVNKGISYEVRTTQPGNVLTVSQQTVPETFIDIPQYYEKVVEQMGSYSTLETTIGKVSLTKKPVPGSKQIAVMREKGTLVFIQADKDQTNDDWRKFLNTLQLL